MFQWMMCFIGQTDTGGCESGEVYFNKIKKVFSEYDSLWCNLRDVGTDGCSAMRSTQHYAGVTAHEDIGESFIAHINRDLCPRKLPAFHSALRIILLAVQDSFKYLPKKLSKYDYCIHTLQGRQSENIN